MAKVVLPTPPLPEEIGIISEAVEKVWDAHGADGNVDMVAKYLRDNHGTIGHNLSLSLSAAAYHMQVLSFIGDCVAAQQDTSKELEAG